MSGESPAAPGMRFNAAAAVAGLMRAAAAGLIEGNPKAAARADGAIAGLAGGLGADATPGAAGIRPGGRTMGAGAWVP